MDLDIVLSIFLGTIIVTAQQDGTALNVYEQIRKQSSKEGKVNG